MDMRTGETYPTLADALAAGVPESDIAEVDMTGPEPRVKFRKHKPFASFKNVEPQTEAAAQVADPMSAGALR